MVNDGEPVVRLPGWYPDDETRGTRYWDGRRWASVVRPLRRFFAAKYSREVLGWPVLLFGLAGVLFMAYVGEVSGGYVAPHYLIMGFFVICAARGLYLVRGRGPSTESVEKRLAKVPYTPPPVRASSAKRASRTARTAATSVSQLPPPAPESLIVAGDCVSCGAPILGRRGKIAVCEYCDTVQQIEAAGLSSR